MKKPKILVLCGLLFSCLVILTACSSQNTTSTKTTTSSSSTTQKATEYYQSALSYLESGENKQAYDELKKIKNISQADKKIQALKNNLKYLLAAKKAVTTADLTTTKTNLDKLANVKTPTALVKQIKELTKEYQAVKLAKHYADEVVQYYNAQNYTAAGGSLQSLKSLSSKYQAVAMLQEQYASYNDKIASAQSSQASSQSSSAATATSQAESSSATSVAESTDSSQAQASSSAENYTNARNSKILNSEYKKETGSELSSAPTAVVSSMSAKMDNQAVLSAFRKATAIPQEAGDQYYVQDLGNDLYQIEIRHTSSADPQVSNLKGMYQFNLSSGVAQKLNEVTGQYERIN
ncbi:MAG: hypothetical protein HDT50_06280 [Lactobacillus sp.]|nr:hypothetical protein [Lactobacillus sp.]